MENPRTPAPVEPLPPLDMTPRDVKEKKRRKKKKADREKMVELVNAGFIPGSGDHNVAEVVEPHSTVRSHVIAEPRPTARSPVIGEPHSTVRSHVVAEPLPTVRSPVVGEPLPTVRFPVVATVFPLQSVDYPCNMSQQLEHIKVRECKAFIHNTKVPAHNNDVYCFCMRLKSWHTERRLPEPESIGWSVQDHTQLVPCNAHGRIKLQGYGRLSVGSKPRYVRIDSMTENLESLWTLLINHWQMPKPTLILSVNGGAKKMAPITHRLKSALKKGIIDVASCTPTWIITGGFQFGVAKLVGEAAKDYATSTPPSESKMAVIGISTWGAVYNRQQLLDENCLRDCEDDDIPLATYYNCKENPGRGQAPLDPYHTHHLFADDGTERMFGKEIQFRAKFEEFIAQKMKQMKKESACPVVQLLIEGGKKAVQTAYQALMNKTPVVVMKGSGRAADVICTVMNDVTESTPDDVADTKIYPLVDKYKDEWNNSDSDRKNLRDNLLAMAKSHRANVHIFNIDGVTKNLDRAILMAVFKSCKNVTTQMQLYLAMSMNRMDMAQHEIFNDQNKGKWKELDLDRAMVKALELNLIDFVKLFLDHGISLEAFLKRDRLNKLYEYIIKKHDSMSHGNDLFREIYESTSSFRGCCRPSSNKDTDDHLWKVGQIIALLNGKSIKNPYDYPEHVQVHKEKQGNRKVIHKSFRRKSGPDITLEEPPSKEYAHNHNGHGHDTETPHGKSGHVHAVHNVTTYPPYSPNNERLYTEQDLFYWALITHRLQLARVFWELGKDHIGSALVANGMLKQLAKYAAKKGEQELMVELEMEAEEYEKLALGVLTTSYTRNKALTHLILVRPLPYFNKQTCLALANQNDCMEFLYHTACQTKLNNIWMGGMPSATPIWKLILNLVFAIFFIRLIFPKRNIVDNKVGPEEGPGPLDESAVHTEASNPREDVEYLSAQSGLNTVSSKIVDASGLEIYCRKQSQGFHNLGYGRSIKLYYQAPVTKFIWNMISYIIFLALYSYMILVEMKHYSIVSLPTPVEIVVWIWVFTMIVEELRQAFVHSNVGFSFKMRQHFSNTWNIFDLIVYVLFVIGVIVRNTVSADQFDHAKRILCITLAMFYVRFMQFYYANKFLGPKVVMVGRMLNDVLFFLCLYVLFVLAYGTLSTAMRFPNITYDWNILRQVIEGPYWAIYGEFDPEEIKGGSETCSATTDPDCSQYSVLAIIAFAVFMLFTNVLLLNLLIAMFGNTFNAVESSSEKVWAFNRYDLIYEFFDRPFLAPPLIVFLIALRIIKSIHKKCRYRRSGKMIRKKPSTIDFVEHLNIHDNSDVTNIEEQCAEMYLNSILSEEQEHNLMEKMDNLTENVCTIRESVEQSAMPVTQSSSDDVMSISSTTPDIQSQVSSIKYTVSQMERKLNKMEMENKQKLDMICDILRRKELTNL